MKMHTHRLTLPILVIMGTLVSLNLATADKTKTVKFEPTVKSFQQYECPDWFRDTKFGIYLHWGAYSVAEQGEWYARNLFIEKRPEYQHHLKTYGHPPFPKLQLAQYRQPSRYPRPQGRRAMLFQ